MKLIRSLSFLGLLLGCALYSYWLTNKDYQWVVPFVDERSPAAVRESQNVGDVLEKPLRVFKRESVASSVMIRTHEGRKSFSMGAFPVKSQSSQQENLMCLEYPYVQLVFTGEGAAINGRKSEVIVTAPCKLSSQTKESIAEMPLPFGELERRPAETQEFEVSGVDIKSHVKVNNLVGVDWPQKWQLERVEFHRDPSFQMNDKVIIHSQELREQLGEPVFIK